MRCLAILMVLALGACNVQQPVGVFVPPAPMSDAPSPLDGRMAARNFINVVETVEPVAEQECRTRTTGVNCDYVIVVDSRPEVPPNAFQTIGEDGRPIVGFTIALIAEARNADELAFILGHEAAHHIRGHIERGRASAYQGAVLAGILATVGGGSPERVRAAQEFGAGIGARRYSKDFELEADALGTVIAARAGYDPVNGAQYFARTPDPGNAFLGTHPPNAQRIATVRQVASGL